MASTWSTSLEQKLRAFSTAANRTSLHPKDEERWRTFVIAAHREHSPVTETDVSEWLAADGWSTEPAQQLGSQYVDERALLAQYDRDAH
jgi:hypothetical protein